MTHTADTEAQQAVSALRHGQQAGEAVSMATGREWKGKKWWIALPIATRTIDPYPLGPRGQRTGTSPGAAHTRAWAGWWSPRARSRAPAGRRRVQPDLLLAMAIARCATLRCCRRARALLHASKRLRCGAGGYALALLHAPPLRWRSSCCCDAAWRCCCCCCCCMQQRHAIVRLHCTGSRSTTYRILAVLYTTGTVFP